jgi:hypothetical protein
MASWLLLICMCVVGVLLIHWSATICYTLRAIQNTLRGIKDNLDRFENQRREALFPWPEEPPDDQEE